jgi:putative CocE/NonD family hydrolase
MRLFVTHGYAWVDVDVRGSGASFGSIAYPFSADEIKDGNEIVDWIVRQPWSDGKVGAAGLSYGADSAEFLLTDNNPAVKAIIPYYPDWDIYNDTSFPGGIYLSWFIENWSRVDDMLDRNAFDELGAYSWYIPYAVRGFAPVDGFDGDALLRQAVAEHNNVRVAQYARSSTYRDDMPSETCGLVDGFSRTVREQAARAIAANRGMMSLTSPAERVESIEASGAAIYSYDGWFDGGDCRGSIARYLSLKNPQKLTIGPWIHGVSRNVLTGEAFDEGGEFLRFFDYWLKGIENGVMSEPRITYYTMVEEKWKTTTQWPLPNQQTAHYYLGVNNGLTATKPAGPHGDDIYQVDYTSGTGRRSRWEPLMGDDSSGGSSTLDYGDRRDADRKLLVYQSLALDRDTEVTGHPVATLFVASSATDGNFFAYLEDLDESGRVAYVTEGELRAVHRKLNGQRSPYYPVCPCHSFLRKDREPLVPGEIAELDFDLLPTSWLFKKGHSIRFAIAGADKDHFVISAGAPPVIRVERNQTYASRLDLPVIPR